MMFERTIQLIGEASFNALQEAKVILFGVGGVGGWCAEALIRTGIKHLTIVDFDTIAESNLNRQIVATAVNVGMPKVEEMQKRLLAINPEADIVAINQKYTPETAQNFPLAEYDYVIDAIDSLDCKMHLIIEASKLEHTTLFSSMGAARKLNPQQVKVAEFWKVTGCPLARSLRTRMKQKNCFPEKKFLCVYSPELSSDSGSYAPIVGTFGFTLASLVVSKISCQAECLGTLFN